MATYKLNKTDGFDSGKSIYEITVMFTDEDGNEIENVQTVGLTKGKVKEEAQAYVDEYEKLYKPIKDK